MYRRRKIARANMAFIPNNQQHGYANQPPPPPPQGGFFGGNGQKEQHGYDGQYNQYNGQHSPQYNPPQYPPTAYDQGHPSQPVSTVPILGFSSFSSLSCRRPRTPVIRLHLVLPPKTKATPITYRELVQCTAMYHNSLVIVPLSHASRFGIHDDRNDLIGFAWDER